MSTFSAFSKTTLLPDRGVYAKQLTIENGLSSNIVYALLQDSKNFFWIGTADGLNKYDGYSFRHYVHNPYDSTSLQSNVIKALVEDRGGSIWVGTSGAGLARLDRNTDKIVHFRTDPSKPRTIGSDNVECLFVDSKGRLWIGLTNGELDYFEPRTEKFWRYSNVVDVNFSLSTNNYIASISEDAFGKLVIRKARGIAIFDPETAKSVPITISSRDQYFNDKRMIRRNDSIIWNPTSWGLYEINSFSGITTNIELRSLRNTIVRLRWPHAAVLDRSGSVWIATENGIVIVEPILQSIEIYPLPEEKDLRYSSARSLCLDNTDRLWVGTSIGSLYFLDSSAKKLYKYLDPHSTTSGAFNRMVADDNNCLWIAGTGYPLLQVNTKDHTSINWKTSIKSQIPSSAHSILKEGTSLWIGSEEREESLNESALNLISFSPFTIHNYEYLPMNKSLGVRRIITSIVRKDKYSLWLGSVHGLYLFDTRDGEFTKYSHDSKNPNSISGDHVWVIHQDRRGQLWVGTWGNGLNLFDNKTGSFRHYMIEDGLPSNNIRSILEDASGDLWIATARGISFYDQNTRTFTNYNVSDGLLDFEYEPNSAAISVSGRMYFGGSKGVTSFYPAALHREHIQVPLAITAFWVSNQLHFAEIQNGRKVTLNYRENNLSFEFAKLDYLDPGQKQYEYMFEGIDDDWVNSGNNNIARYSNIEPGEYTFRFRLRDDTSRAFASIFVVTPPLWMTWWFKIGILFATVMLVGHLYRKRSLKLAEFQFQLEMAAENERVELAGELHDGPLQDLYATRFILDPLLRIEDSATYATKLDTVLKKVRGDLRTLTGDLQIPHFESGFADELRLYCDSFGERHPTIQIVCDINDERKPIPLRYAQNLFRILRTAMANIAEHANASRIEVSFVTTEVLATLMITDDGIGFIVPDGFVTFSQNKHYGLFLMQNYVASMKGQCLVHSSPGKGTLIEVIIPLKPSFWRKMTTR